MVWFQIIWKKREIPERNEKSSKVAKLFELKSILTFMVLQIKFNSSQPGVLKSKQQGNDWKWLSQKMHYEGILATLTYNRCVYVHIWLVYKSTVLWGDEEYVLNRLSTHPIQLNTLAISLVNMLLDNPCFTSLLWPTASSKLLRKKKFSGNF